MFVGHFAPAFAARAVLPELPLWALVAATDWLDVAWSILVLTGVERMDVAPSGTVRLTWMPYSHSLVSALGWALTWIIAARARRLPWIASGTLGTLVLGHWGLDWLVHDGDLLLGWGTTRAGFGYFSDNAYALATLEALLVAGAASAAAWRFGRLGLGLGATIAPLAALSVSCFIATITPVSARKTIALSSLLPIMAVIVVSWAADRHRARVDNTELARRRVRRSTARLRLSKRMTDAGS